VNKKMSSRRNQKPEETTQEAPRARRRPQRTEEDDGDVETKPAPRKPAAKVEAEKPAVRKPVAKVEPEAEKPAPRKPAAKVEAEKPAPRKPATESEDSKSKKKVPTEEELRKKFLDEFPKLVKAAQQKSSFLKAWNPKNPLTTGGMAKRLKDNQDKTGSDEIVYSIEMHITGSRADFEALFKEQTVKEWMKSVDLTRDEVIDNFITFDNFGERKDSEEIKTLRDTNTRVINELNHRQELFNNYFSKAKNTTPQTKQERIISSFESYIEMDKVYDVCNWNSEHKNGYKSVPRPSVNSKRRVMKTYPISSLDERRMREFLEFLELDPDLAKEAFPSEK